MKLKTHKEFLKEIKEKNHKLLEEFEIIGNYRGTKAKILLRGEFGVVSMTPPQLLNGSIPDIKSALDKNEYIINMFKEVHGNQFNYSKVQYVNTTTKVKIICSEHGVFLQTPSSHLQGRGCPKCAGNKHYSNDEFIKMVNKIHNNKYNYTKTNYVNSYTDIIVTCPTHGDFIIHPGSHRRGQGCTLCGSGKHRSTMDFVTLAKEVHGDTYNYDKFLYKNAKHKGIITCMEHGDFLQAPNNHLNGQGCPICANLKTGAFNSLSFSEFIKRSNVTHKFKYDYSMINNFKNASSMVSIVCPTHGLFIQRAISHYRGSGCPICGNTKSNFEKYYNQKTILYYIKIDNYFKIGLTKSSINERFNRENVDIDVIDAWTFENGMDAFNIEQKILQITVNDVVPLNEVPIEIGKTELRIHPFHDIIINYIEENYANIIFE